MPDDGIVRIVYEEAYINMNGLTDLNGAARQQSLLSGKEYIVERMKDRRKDRVRDIKFNESVLNY